MRLAIIGAGMAGLAAARVLHTQRPDIETIIFEKSRGLGGRAATRRRDGYAFDHGAQLFKLPTPALEKFVRHALSTEGLQTINPPVWAFDRYGRITPGDQAQNAEVRYTYADGISTLGKLLGAGLQVQREVRVAALEHNEGWTLRSITGEALGTFDAVLFTPPAPQISEMLHASTLVEPLKVSLLEALVPATYRRCLSVTLSYSAPLSRPFYALVNNDKAHPASWVALEHVKGSRRCPPGHSLVTVQFAPGASTERWEQPAPDLYADADAVIKILLGEDLPAPLWGDRQGWRYALPDGQADFDALNTTGSGLFFAGDFTAGQGRVHAAIEQGWRVAERIAAM